MTNQKKLENKIKITNQKLKKCENDFNKIKDEINGMYEKIYNKKLLIENHMMNYEGYKTDLWLLKRELNDLEVN